MVWPCNDSKYVYTLWIVAHRTIERYFEAGPVTYVQPGVNMKIIGGTQSSYTRPNLPTGQIFLEFSKSVSPEYSSKSLLQKVPLYNIT